MSVGRKRILWVSGEIEFFRSIITFLETRGYSVVSISSCSELLEMIGQNTKIADLILIDTKADGAEDVSIVLSIRKTDSNLPIVLISQSNEDPGKNDPAAKIDAVISRPFSASQLLAICKTPEFFTVSFKTIERLFTQLF